MFGVNKNSRLCGYQAFGTIDGYPGGVTRYWFSKALCCKDSR